MPFARLLGTAPALVAAVLALAACSGSRRSGEPPVPPPAVDLKGPGLVAPPEAPSGRPLEVTYLSPSGPQDDLPAQIVAIFSEPMVALGAPDAAPPVPLALDPPVPVRARWVGTRTAVLAPEAPLRFATSYRVRVPAGVAAVSGARLAADATREFETPRPAVEGTWPRPGETRCDPRQVFVLEFNQPVTAADVQAKTSFQAGRGRPVAAEAWVPRSAAEHADVVRRFWLGVDLEEFLRSGRWILVRPARPLPADRPFRLVVDRGLKGAGNLPSARPFAGDYRVVGPLRVVAAGCRGPCRPERPWEAAVEFSNPVCEAEFRRKVRHDTPAANPGYGGYCTTRWALVEQPKAGTAYDVTLPGDLADERGQRLGRDVAIHVEFGHLAPRFSDLGGGGVQERASPRQYPLEALNLARVQGEAAPVPRDRLARTLLARPDAPLADLGLAPVPADLPAPEVVDQPVVFPWDLSSIVPAGGTGAVAWRLRGLDASGQAVSYPGHGVLQVTDLGLTAHLGDQGGTAWVTRLSTGEPVGGATVEVRSETDTRLWTGTTGPDGTAPVPGLRDLGSRLPAPTAPGPDTPVVAPAARMAVLASLGTDASAVRVSDGHRVWPEYPGSRGFEDAGDLRDWRVALVLDRDAYREGEEVRIKGWVRRMLPDGPRRVPGGTATLDFFAPSEGGEEESPVASRAVFFDEYGAFSASWKVSAGARRGAWRIVTRLPGEEDERWGLPVTEFQVQDFQPPEFTVATTLDRREYIRGDRAVAATEAAYYQGGVLAGAPVAWSVSFEPTSFVPPGGEGYSFDDPDRDADETEDQDSPDTRLAAQDAQALDDRGAAAHGFLALPPWRAPVRVAAEADVRDVTGRSVAGRASALVHPAEFYLGVRAPSVFGRAGEGIEAQVIALDPGGRPAALERLEVQAVRREWHTVRRKGIGGQLATVSEPVDVPVGSGTVALAAGKGTWTFTPPSVGLYRVFATATDRRGSRVRSGATLWITGPGVAAWEAREDDRVALVPDRESYAPGQTARILVRSPFASAWALVTVERRAILWQKVARLDGNAGTIDIPVAPAFVPDVDVAVVVVRGRIADREPGPGTEDLGAPAVRAGALRLRVTPSANRLAVTVQPAPPEVRPGDPVQVSLEVRDPAGRPARSQLLVMAVDEAFLDLTGYALRDPFDTFFAMLDSDVRTADSRDFLVRRREYGGKARLPGGDGGGGGGVPWRKAFNPVAFFDPAVVTDGDGKARVSFTAPDTLTRYRVLAVAASGDDRFGTGQSRFAVTRPLVVRPALPAFAEPGDRFSLTVAIHGSPGVEGEATVRATVTGSARLAGAAEARAAVSGKQPGQVSFDVEAGDPGDVEVRVQGALGKHQDGVVLRLPVRRRVRTETVATGGAVPDTVAENVTAPRGAVTGTGGLAVTVSSTALVGLGEATRFLLGYPYGCLEQRLSAALPILLARDLAVAFGQGATPADLDQGVRDTMARLGRFQKADGGFGYWPGADLEPPSVHLTGWALVVANLAKARGFAPDPAVEAAAGAWLSRVLRGPQDGDEGLPRPGRDEAAFLAWVLASRGQPVADVVSSLAAGRRELTSTGKAWLAAAAARTDLPANVRQDLLAEALDGAVVKGDEGWVPNPDGDPDGLGSADVVGTCAALIAVSEARPDHPLAARLARHLMAIRREGRWATTHENGLALLALVSVLAGAEREVPDLKATAWLGPDALATWTFRGRSLDARRVDVPLQRLIGTTAPLVLARSGTGPLYWTAALTWAFAADAPPRDAGIGLARDVRRLSGLAQATTLRRGETALVTVTMTTDAALDRVALDVPVPAGLSPVNFDFRTASDALRRQVEVATVRGTEIPCTHREVRDDRVTCFADRVPPGVLTLRFAVRATVPGRFAWPGARAEEMYHPETYGTSEGGFFEVLP